MSLLPPYFVYFDQTRISENCKLEFIFSTIEQKHWYEKLKFWVQSYPKHCPNCRNIIRIKKNINTKISIFVKEFKDKGDSISIEKLIQIIELYSRIGKREKAKYYLSVLKKKF
ncbi:MAG: zinc-ribbon domain containing protein, partial [Leptospiraceae bacterium]|nr:zinc-ribbon domain containing protein [Leptospiraceae bacterium]